MTNSTPVDKNGLILIVGGGPAGFGAALAFHNNKYTNIVVLEGRADLNFDVQESYPIGLNVRGQTSINKLVGDEINYNDTSRFGLIVNSWKVIVGPGINVATIDSGLSFGSSRAGVTQLLYSEVEKRGSHIKVLFDHKAIDVDVKRHTLTCQTSTGEKKEFQPVCLVIADGYRSRVRDRLAEQDNSLHVQQWPWPYGFRALFSEIDPPTELDAYTHYVYNSIYLAKFLNGKWGVVLSLRDNAPEFLFSEESNEENVRKLKKFLKDYCPPALDLVNDEECARYFKRKIFKGAVTKVNKLVIDDWAVLLGDAAHSAIPATGEGINSAVEDCSILNEILLKNKSIPETLNEFQRVRLEDVNALSNYAYSATKMGIKDAFQGIVLSFFKRIKLIDGVKDDFLFGKKSNEVQRYSEIMKLHERQTKFIGGPSFPRDT
jgi:kynurenine 3-monooxygenase